MTSPIKPFGRLPVFNGMRKMLPVLSAAIILGLLFSCRKSGSSNAPPSATDSFAVRVTNGYGSGQYKVGDTVHIFSNAYGGNQLFGTWTGDITLLNAPDEWHTWFVMPDKEVNVTGSTKNIPDFTLQYEQIMGRDRLKPVYSYFPQGHRGIVYLLHGTGGNAANIVNDYEWQQIIGDLVNDQFAVIITEAEEATTQVDANGDGSIRWAILPYDTITNVDYANIRIITDSFCKRGVTDHAKPGYSIGMSDGGFFSAALSSIYHFKAGVQYCAQGNTNVIQNTSVPIQFCMARFDSNPEVGAAGNADALANSSSLNARGVCSKYLINERSPLYPERFARSGVISTTQSTAIFNELKSAGYVDSKNYYIGYSDSLISAMQNNPAGFPVIRSLSLNQQVAMLEQINIAVSDHHIYGDYNRATLKFLENQCQ